MVTVGGESSPVIPLDSGSTQRAMTGSGRGTRTVVAKPLPPRQQMSPALTNLVPTHQAPSPLQGRAMHDDHLPDLTSYNIKLYAKYMIHRVLLHAPPPPPPPPPPNKKDNGHLWYLTSLSVFLFFFFSLPATNLTQLASQLPKLTPEVILASMKQIQQQQQAVVNAAQQQSLMQVNTLYKLCTYEGPRTKVVKSTNAWVSPLNLKYFMSYRKLVGFKLGL